MKIEDEVTDVICDKCGRNMVIKYGPHGKFLACPGFPECKNTKPYLEKIGVACPKCGKDIVIRKTKKGRKILRLRGQSGMRLHVLAETLRKTVSEMRFYACRKKEISSFCSGEACNYVENKIIF